MSLYISSNNGDGHRIDQNRYDTKRQHPKCNDLIDIVFTRHLDFKCIISHFIDIRVERKN